MSTFVNSDNLELPAVAGPFDASKPGYMKLMAGDDGHLYFIDEAGGITRVTLVAPESLALEKFEAALSDAVSGELLSLDGDGNLDFIPQTAYPVLDLPLLNYTPEPAPINHYRFYVDLLTGELGRVNSDGVYERVSIGSQEKDILANVNNALENGAANQLMSLTENGEFAFVDPPAASSNPKMLIHNISSTGGMEPVYTYAIIENTTNLLDDPSMTWSMAGATDITFPTAITTGIDICVIRAWSIEQTPVFVTAKRLDSYTIRLTVKDSAGADVTPTGINVEFVIYPG